MTMRRAARWAPVVVLGGLLIALYADVVPSMLVRWWEDEGYSHGFLVVPLAGWLAWRQRAALAGAPAERDNRGLILVCLAAASYVIGKLGAEFFLTRMSLVFMLAGLIWTFRGWGWLKRLAFPLLLLASTVPLPVLVYNRLAGPLQLVASAASTELAQALGISVYRDGNIIHLATTTLGVAEACSGLRSISSLAVAALLLCYLELRRPLTRVTLVLMALPIAVLFNVIRVAGTAMLSERDPLMGTGFYHGFSGWLIFLCGFGLLWLAGRTLKVLFETRLVGGGTQ
jgi:exosortase